MLNPLLQDVPEVIETDRLTLRCPRLGDGEALYAAVSESLPELRRYLAAVPCNDPAEPAQLTPLKRRPQQAFSCRAPDAGAGGYRNRSSR